MPFKGTTRRYSNRYHLHGGTPPDDTHWHTLFDNIVTAEKALLTSDQVIVSAIGYAAGSDVPVSSKTYSTAGTLSSTSSLPAPGEAAGMIRYSTAARTSKNHPVYLFNYYHAPRISSLSGGDGWHTTQHTAAGTYAAAWIAGFSDGATTYTRAGPNGAQATGSFIDTYVTHRDFPYSSSV